MAEGNWALRDLSRKVPVQSDQNAPNNLNRCLNCWDLTALGLGSTLGVGVYVLVGTVALKVAGPSVVLSFLIAAFASLFAGLCYAEFGSRVPRAGSAYIYTYVTVGELAAFVIGWNMILESIFGAASVARGLSLYVDLISGRAMSAWFLSFAPLSSAGVLATYFDFFAFGIVLVLAVLLAIGVRESAIVNNLFAVLNMAIIAFIIVAGAFTANTSNWFIEESTVPPNYGVGGFFPYGVWGMMKGAAICFYGFVGFDSISSTSEEVQEPRRTIPQAILVVLALVFIAYASVAIVITMMVPYYLQDTVASAFSYVGWDWAKWIVSVGAIFGISASLFGAMFPLPRLLYAMASDGLFFPWFAKVDTDRKTPVIGTLLPSAVIALLAGLLSLEQLVLMMCVGTLLSYTIVAACVIILRYSSLKSASMGIMQQLKESVKVCGSRSATKTTSLFVNILLTAFIVMCVITSVVTVHVEQSLVPSLVLHVIVLLLLIAIMLQPKSDEDVPFKTPLVPVIPCFSIYINICLMVMINLQTWIRIGVWVALGIPIYIICVCCYKQHHQKHDDVDAHAQKNGKPAVQIIIESPTPPDTINRTSNNGGDKVPTIDEPVEMKEKVVKNIIQEVIIVQQSAIIENNEEKEANIIDLLDQVLQAEEDTYGSKEDTYGELIAEKEEEVIISTAPEYIPHRKSLSELSDAGSDASLGNQVLSKYDVIAQVHREDLPKVSEEDDQNFQAEVENEVYEQVTAFNDSDTNSQTDESGYSDTIDKTALNESVEEIKEDVPYIPVPPPFDENYFKSPNFRKSYTISARPSRIKPVEDEETKPRESIKSNNSQDDNNIIFGSERQLHFMSKLNVIYQSKIADQEEEQTSIKPGRRSNSTGNVIENTAYDTQERPPFFSELKKVVQLKETSNLLPINKETKAAPNLRPINKETKEAPNLRPINKKESEEVSEIGEDVSLSKDDLKSKLENIFAAGGTMLVKPRLMKSNPPTPEESYQTDTSSTDSIAKLPKMEKNDTLGRQRVKFGQVLNSFRLSLNKDDEV